MDDDEREVALELGEGATDRFDEIAVVVPLDEMGHGLGICLGGEAVALLAQLHFELAVVLDDAVEHDGDALGVTACERVRVLLRDGTVRRPAGMSKAGRCPRSAVRRPLFQVVQIPDRTDVRQAVLLEQGEPGRVVAAVLEPLETPDE